MNENNPFLNIFNGRYNSSNSQENLLANGLLPYSFNNVFNRLFYPLINIDLGYAPDVISNTNTNLEHMPTLVDNTNIQHTGILGAIKNSLKHPTPFTYFPISNINTGILGAIKNSLYNNHQLQPTNPLSSYR